MQKQPPFIVEHFPIGHDYIVREIYAKDTEIWKYVEELPAEFVDTVEKL